MPSDQGAGGATFYDWRCPDCGSGVTKVHMMAGGPQPCGKPPGYWTRGEAHAFSVVSSFLRPGQWVECSCGWASPDLQFPTDAEAVEWARQEHLGARQGSRR